VSAPRRVFCLIHCVPCYHYRQLEFRTQLLQALDNETDAYMKARITDIVGELANFVIDEWPEILPYAHHCLQVLLVCTVLLVCRCSVYSCHSCGACVVKLLLTCDCLLV
jgi:hypothetical protein